MGTKIPLVLDGFRSVMKVQLCLMYLNGLMGRHADREWLGTRGKAIST
jgi:hypothetical protein